MTDKTRPMPARKGPISTGGMDHLMPNLTGGGWAEVLKKAEAEQKDAARRKTKQRPHGKR